MSFTLGVDVACRAVHQASLTAADGRIISRATTFVRFSSEMKLNCVSGSPSSPTWQNWQRTPSAEVKLRIVPITWSTGVACEITRTFG